MKITFLFVTLFLTTLSFTQLNKLDAKGKKQGSWEKKYPNSGVVEYKGEFKNDLPVGKFIYNYPSNKLKATISNDAKSINSFALMYHESGSLMAKGKYFKQQKDSIWTYFNPNGILRMRECYKNGKLDGERIIYYSSEYFSDKKDRIASIEKFQNDLKEGESVEYFDDTTRVLKSTGNFHLGKKEGTFYSYFPNGKISSKENYKNDLRESWQYAYNEQGEEIGKRYFKKGIELKGKELQNCLKELDNNKNPTEK